MSKANIDDKSLIVFYQNQITWRESQIFLSPTRRPARLDQLELFAAMPDASALTGEL